MVRTLTSFWTVSHFWQRLWFLIWWKVQAFPCIYINDTTICWARRQPKQIRNFTDNFNFSENHRKMAAWICLVRVWLYLYSFDAWHRNKTNIIWKKELKHLTSAPNFPNEVIVLSIFGGSHAVLICGPNKVNIRKFNYVQHQTGRFKNYSPYKHQKWDCFRFTIDKLSVLDTSKMYYHKVEITAIFFLVMIVRKFI